MQRSDLISLGPRVTQTGARPRARNCNVNFLRLMICFQALLCASLLGCVFSTYSYAADISTGICEDHGSDSVVTGATQDRLYLHTAYPPECKSGDKCESKTYLLTGDVVSVRTTCGGWSYVEYTNKNLKQSAGWVEASRAPISGLVPVNELQKLADQTVKTIKIDSRRQTIGDICRRVADYANRGVLDRFEVRAGKWKSAEELTPIFGDSLFLANQWHYWNIDLNADGLSEHVVMSTQGTGHFGVGMVLSKKPGSTVQEFPSAGDSPDLSFIRLGTGYYFLSGDRDNPRQMYGFSKNGEFESVCTFKQSDEPESRLILGQGRSVCSDVATDKVQFIDLIGQHSISLSQGDNRFGDMMKEVIGYDLANVDIDNDGKVDSVISLNLYRPGGRACDLTQLAVTDNHRTNIPRNEPNEILIKSLDQWCGTKMSAFVHSGTTYIDMQSNDGDRSVYLLRGSKIDTVCKFRGQFVTHVAN